MNSLWILYKLLPSAGSDVDVNCHWQKKIAVNRWALWWLERCCEQDKWDQTISKSYFACRPKPLPAINPISSFSRHHRGIFFCLFSPPVLLSGKQRRKSFQSLLTSSQKTCLFLHLFHILTDVVFKVANSCTFTLTTMSMNSAQDPDLPWDPQISHMMQLPNHIFTFCWRVWFLPFQCL